jgi:hypothetical protein
VPHVELSLIDSRRLTGRGSGRNGSAVPQQRPTHAPDQGTPPVDNLRRWAAVVMSAPEPSLVLDADTLIVAASSSCAELIGLRDPAMARGRRLRDAGVNLVDFTDPPDTLDKAEAVKIPPLLAITSGRLARGLMRVVCPRSSQAHTMDAVATPLWEGRTVVGSLTFFSMI